MDIEQITEWVEHPLRPDPDETENRFFQGIRHAPDQIHYDQLRQINFPVIAPANPLHDLVGRFGIEILAYYIPFHFHRPDRPWGIYLRRVGIDHVRQRLMEIAGQDGHNFQNLAIPTNVAEHILLLHELRHHAIEVAFTRVELQQGTRREYQHYIREKRNHNDLHNHTEAICNANVAKHHFKTDWQLPGIISPPNVIVSLDWNNYVREFMLGQPAGYNDFERFTRYSSRRVLESLQLPTGFRLDLAQIREEFSSHSKLGTLNRVVPIRPA